MPLGKELLIDMYRQMFTARKFDESWIDLWVKGVAKGMSPHSGIGQEAIGVGVCNNLKEGDYLYPNYRCLFGSLITLGAPLGPIMAELAGKATGLSKGKGGIHICDPKRGLLGLSGIVSAQISMCVGAALSLKMKGGDQVCYCGFGDGGAHRGPFHESLNLASVWKLPIIFVCDNNGYAAYTAYKKVGSIANIADRAAGYNMPGMVVDGNDVIAVYKVANEAVQRARSGLGPTLIECKTYRWRSHAERLMENRPKEEIHKAMGNDPIKRLKQKILDDKIATESELNKIDQEAVAQVEDAVKFTIESPEPGPEEALKDVYIT